MLNILEKHKLIGGSGGRNTLTYLETTDEDFNEGELSNVIVEDGKLQIPKISPNCLVYYPFTENLEDIMGNTTITDSLGTLAIDTTEKALKVSTHRSLLKGLKLANLEQFTVEYMWKPTNSTYGGCVFVWGMDQSIHPLSTNGANFGYWDGTNRIANIVPTLNEWCHQMYTYNKGENKLYHNGELVLTWTRTKSLTDSDVTLFSHTSGAQYNQGYVKHLKFHSVALTEPTKDLLPPNPFKTGYRISPQITTPRNLVSAKCDWEGEGKVNLYNYTSNEGIDDNTVLLIRDNFEDISKFNKEVISNNATISNEGKFTKSIDLSTNSTVKVMDGFKGIDLSKDFTIDWWEYSTGTSVASSGLFTNRTVTSSNYARGFLIGYGGTTIYAGTTSATTSWNMFNAITFKDKVDNEWIHWALVKQGSTWTSYKNGVKFWTASNSNVIGQTDGDNMTLGAWVDNNNINTGYNALICEFRMSNVARWTKDFTPPSCPYLEDDVFDLPLNKNETILSVPPQFHLKEELKEGETISNVSLEMRSKLGNFYMSPKDDKDTSKFYLYNEGDECTDITGGWKNGEFMNLSNTSWLVSAYAIKNTNNLEYGDNNANGTWYGYGGFITNSKVDLTPYSKMFIDWEMYQASVTTYNGGSGSVVNAIAYSDSTSVKVGSGLTQLASIVSKQGAYNTNRVVTEIDISNISGQKHICVNGQAGYINTDLVKNRTYKIWLEK